MKPASLRREKFLWRVCKLSSASEGATAVEFALVAPVFLILLFAILQIALLSWLSRDLQRALEESARPILTGSFQSAQNQSAQQALSEIKQSLCSKAVLVSCSELLVDLQVAKSFGELKDFSAFDAATRTWTSGFGSNYGCLSPGAIVVLRAATKFPVIFSFLVPVSMTFEDGSKPVQANFIFRTEPYSPNASLGTNSTASSSSASTSGSTVNGGC